MTPVSHCVMLLLDLSGDLHFSFLTVFKKGCVNALVLHVNLVCTILFDGGHGDSVSERTADMQARNYPASYQVHNIIYNLDYIYFETHYHCCWQYHYCLVPMVTL